MTSVLGAGINVSSNKKAGCALIVRRAAALLAGLVWATMPAARAGEIPPGLADPTRPSFGGAPVEAAESPSTGPALQSTLVSASQRRATISGRAYSVGDKLGGAVVADIQSYEVVLEQAGRETRLRLLPRLAKQAHIVKVPADSQEKWHRDVPSTDRRTEGGNVKWQDERAAGLH